MSTGEFILSLALLSLTLWTVNIVWIVVRRHRHIYVPNSVVSACLVAVMSACVGGTLTSLGFLGVATVDMTATIGAAWRAGMFIAAVYGTIGAIRAARAKPLPDPTRHRERTPS